MCVQLRRLWVDAFVPARIHKQKFATQSVKEDACAPLVCEGPLARVQSQSNLSAVPSMTDFNTHPQPRTFAPSKEDVLQNLQYFFGTPLS